MQSDDQIQRKLLFLMMLQIPVFLIATLLPYDVNAQTLHNQTLEEKLSQIGIVTDNNPQISVGDFPKHIEIIDAEGKIYVVNSRSNTVSVISATENNTKIKDIPVGEGPSDIDYNPITNTLYVANSRSNTVSVISAENDTKIKDIPVGEGPGYIDFNPITNTFYVAYSGSKTVSVISVENNTEMTKISVENNTEMTKIQVGEGLGDIDFNPITNTLYVANSDSNTVSVISAENGTKIKDIPVGEGHVIIHSTFDKVYVANSDSTTFAKVYVANSDSNTVSVISAENDEKVTEIPVGEEGPIAIYATFDKVYVANSRSNTVSVISAAENNTKIKDIRVGEGPSDIDYNPITNTLYVANSDSNTVSVISAAENDTKIKDIRVGEGPGDIDFNPITNTLYVANSDSDSISVIDGVTNKVVAGVKYNINPPNSGYIKCNNLDVPLNQFLYVSSECTAKPNKGFEFISWTENLENNSTRTVRTSAEDNYILESLYDFLNIKPDDPAASLFEFGTYTANFKELPPPIPSEYLIPLYGIIITILVTTGVGLFISRIKNWRKTNKDIKKLDSYHDEIKKETNKIIEKLDHHHDESKKNDNDGKLYEDLDHLKNSILDDYSKGKLNEKPYERLQNEISLSYEEIFKKRVNSAINDSTTDKEYKKKKFNKINEDIEDAYSKSNINKLHYKLLKRKLNP